MRWLRFGLGLLAALAVHAALDRWAPRPLASIDPYLVVVIYFATAGNLLASIVAGVVAGLAHDAMSSAIVGIHAFGLTLTGYLAAWLSSRIVLKGTVAFGACLGVASLLNETIVALLLGLLVKQNLDLLFQGIVAKTIGTTILGMAAWKVLGSTTRESDAVAATRWEERR